MFCAQNYRKHPEFQHLVDVFTKNPHLLTSGSCIYSTNKTMDGFDYLIGIGNGKTVKGELKYSSMNGLNEKKCLEKIYQELINQ